MNEYFSLPLLLAPLALLAWRWVVGRRRPVMLTGLLLTWTVYVVGVGGDAFAHGRFFAPIVPLLALCAGALVEDVGRALGRVSIAAMVAAALVIAALGAHVAPLWRSGPGGPRFLSADSVSGMCLAGALRQAPLPREALIAVYFAGTLPYYMPGFRFHDMLGKSDRVIARGPARQGPPGHNKWNYGYSLGRLRPAVIVTAGPFDGADEAVYRARIAFHPALWLDPLFRSKYRRVEVVHDGRPVNTYLWVYARREMDLARLTAPEGTCAAMLKRYSGRRSRAAGTRPGARG